MIVFDLSCSKDHVFEAWFRSSDAFETQKASGYIACPICGVTDIAKAIMAPAVSPKGNRLGELAPENPPQRSPQKTMLQSDAQSKMREILSALAQAQSEALKDSRWVGDDFADRARAMHYGEEPQTLIHGAATPQDARAMLDEGLRVAPLLVPIAPPDEIN